ncbi:MAG: hypothetical protein Q8L40_10715, partial [Burkholderiales bacterium]|nr:hypothetical protein [Burkholderiales bacterium]
DISKGLTPAGIEYYLPLFFEQTATLFDYLPENTLLCLHQDVRPIIDEFWRDTQSRYQVLRGDMDRPLLPPQELFLSSDSFFGKIKPYARVEILSSAQETKLTAAKPTLPLPPVQVNRHAENPLEKLVTFISRFTQSGGRILLLAESMGRRELIAEYLNQYGLHPDSCQDYAQFLTGSQSFMLSVAPLHTGFILESGNARLSPKANCIRPMSMDGVNVSHAKPHQPIIFCVTCQKSNLAIRLCMSSMASADISAW